MAFDPTPINVKDAAGTSTPMIAYSDGTNKAFARPVLDNTGALISPATSGNQTTANSTLATIASQTSGLATASAQATGNSSLASVATNTTAIDTAIGARNDTVASSDTGTFSLIALVKRGLQGITTLVTNTTSLATAAAQTTGNTTLSTIATNTTSIATAANQTTHNTKLDSIITNTTGVATAANQSTGNTTLSTIAGNTGAGSVNLTITPTVTAGAYTTGMVAGGKLSLTNAVRASGGGGIIQSVSVTKKTALTQPYDVFFFHTDPSNSTFTDNSALNLLSADNPYLIGVAKCTDLVSCGTPQTVQALNVALPFKLATGTTLFAVAVIRGAETLASTSALIINVGIIQD